MPTSPWSGFLIGPVRRSYRSENVETREKAEAVTEEVRNGPLVELLKFPDLLVLSNEGQGVHT